MDLDTQILRPPSRHDVADHRTVNSAMTSRAVLALIGWIALCLLAGAAGSVVSGPDAWYRALEKPAWNPPPTVFGPVWTTLYILMGVAAWLVWRTPAGAERRRALTWFLLQLVLNVAWSWLFFGAHRPDVALIEIAVLWVAIASTIAAFDRLSRRAAALLVPYLAWVSFAITLNAGVWWLNR